MGERRGMYTDVYKNRTPSKTRGLIGYFSISTSTSPFYFCKYNAEKCKNIIENRLINGISFPSIDASLSLYRGIHIVDCVYRTVSDVPVSLFQKNDGDVNYMTNSKL